MVIMESSVFVFLTVVSHTGMSTSHTDALYDVKNWLLKNVIHHHKDKPEVLVTGTHWLHCGSYQVLSST